MHVYHYLYMPIISVTLKHYFLFYNLKTKTKNYLNFNN